MHGPSAGRPCQAEFDSEAFAEWVLGTWSCQHVGGTRGRRGSSHVGVGRDCQKYAAHWFSGQAPPGSNAGDTAMTIEGFVRSTMASANMVSSLASLPGRLNTRSVS